MAVPTPTTLLPSLARLPSQLPLQLSRGKAVARLRSDDAKAGEKAKLALDPAAKREYAKHVKEGTPETPEQALLRHAEEEVHLFDKAPDAATAKKRLAVGAGGCQRRPAGRPMARPSTTTSPGHLEPPPRSHATRLRSQAYETKLEKLRVDMKSKDENKDVALGTSASRVDARSRGCCASIASL